MSVISLLEEGVIESISGPQNSKLSSYVAKILLKNTSTVVFTFQSLILYLGMKRSNPL